MPVVDPRHASEAERFRASARAWLAEEGRSDGERPPGGVDRIGREAPAMAYLLGKLVKPIGDGEWRVRVRNEDAVAVGAPPKAVAETAVLLRPAGERWEVVRCPTVHPWPQDFPRDVAGLWRARGAPVGIDVSHAVTSSGTSVLDPRGTPCERGLGRIGDQRYEILNYAGWQLAALGGREIQVYPSEQGGRTYWIIPPDSVLDAPVSPEPDADPAPAPFVPPPTAPPPRPVPVDVRLRFSDLTFTDGSVQLTLRGHALTVLTDLAHEVYNDVRAALDDEVREGVRAVGELHADGAWVGELRGLEALASAFTTVTRRRFVERGLALPTWADAQALMAELSGAGDPLDRLLDLPEFCFERRKEAFRRLFEIRVREEPVRVLPGRAIVVPLPAAGGGRPWLAWEKTSGDYATYMFRPATDEQRDDLLAWAQDPASRRRDLLRDEPLAESLAFHGRVMHRSAGGDDLAGWWRRLRATLAAEPRR